MKHVFYPVIVALIAVWLARFLYSSWNQICPLAFCIVPVVRCWQHVDCRPVLDCFAECNNEDSKRRKESAIKYQHVQFPHDPDLCRYTCLDMMTTPEAERVLECFGNSNCMAPAEFPDECAPIEQDQVLPLSVVPNEVLQGVWTKLFTNSWDVWPCQTTEFSPPGDYHPLPKDWMKAWPGDPNVWRMDFNWTVVPDSTTAEMPKPHTFSMSNEMYPGQYWDFYGSTCGAKPTLRTRAPMWGTEAHENWYLLHYDPVEHVMIIHACAYTPQVDAYDAITLVLQKDGIEHPREALSDKLAMDIQHVALQKLGEKFGTLLRIKPCYDDMT